ncbi:MAG TPA: type IV toxin-antitoxin system AbiEi family antitoxin domain-containing protein [Anaerolineaceae bacterium]|nr:type IV toxin-antitoxin system AbiEi family antitoxin domain-containing protein [Anaerolineaceae bacterium]
MDQAIKIFTAHKGILRTSQALALGIAPRTLYAMRDAGLIRKISRGVYQLADQELPGNPDLVSVALRIPKAVICLISALHFYGLTAQIPHKVYIALPQAAEKPRLDFPPLDIVWLSDKSYTAGVLEQQVDGVQIKIYSREKTIADCFKFRNKIGMDVALEALKDYIKTPNRQIDLLLSYARLDRVETLLSRYLEALL